MESLSLVSPFLALLSSWMMMKIDDTLFPLCVTQMLLLACKFDTALARTFILFRTAGRWSDFLAKKASRKQTQ